MTYLRGGKATENFQILYETMPSKFHTVQWALNWPYKSKIITQWYAYLQAQKRHFNYPNTQQHCCLAWFDTSTQHSFVKHQVDHSSNGICPGVNQGTVA